MSAFAELPDTPVAQLRTESGTIFSAPAHRWLESCDEVDESVLTRVHTPVLDVGCGPGRHGAELADRGNTVLGVDVSRHAIEIARSRGLTVVEQSIFDALPGAGTWGSILLLDGNIGIGGDPLVLLQRARQLVHPSGNVLIETEDISRSLTHERVRLELYGEAGPWFEWARLACSDMDRTARAAGFAVAEHWVHDQRHFVMLQPIREA